MQLMTSPNSVINSYSREDGLNLRKYDRPDSLKRYKNLT